jgi:hypothetical protein
MHHMFKKILKQWSRWVINLIASEGGDNVIFAKVRGNTISGPKIQRPGW